MNETTIISHHELDTSPDNSAETPTETLDDLNEDFADAEKINDLENAPTFFRERSALDQLKCYLDLPKGATSDEISQMLTEFLHKTRSSMMEFLGIDPNSEVGSVIRSFLDEEIGNIRHSEPDDDLSRVFIELKKIGKKISVRIANPTHFDPDRPVEKAVDPLDFYELHGSQLIPIYITELEEMFCKMTQDPNYLASLKHIYATDRKVVSGKGIVGHSLKVDIELPPEFQTIERSAPVGRTITEV